jgi:ribosomal protein S15P/S13E
MANLQQIAHKYRVSENYLNSKEDGLLIVAESIKDLANELNTLKIDENRKQSMIEKMERLSEFCKDVKNSGV